MTVSSHHNIGDALLGSRSGMAEIAQHDAVCGGFEVCPRGRGDVVGEVVEFAVHFEIKIVPCVLAIGFVFARSERTSDCNFLIERMALGAFDDVDIGRPQHQIAEDLLYRRNLVAEVGRHHLQGFVVDSIDNIAVNYDVVWLAIGNFCYPFVHIQPAFPQPFLELVLADGVAFVAKEVRRP